MSMKMQAIKFSTTWKRVLGVLAIGLVFFLYGADCKRSACWRYGHVCWGGHGKRSGQPPLILGSSEAGDGSDLYSPQWNRVEKERMWNLHPKQFVPLPLYLKPQNTMRQPLALVDNSNAKGQIPPLYLMQPQLSKQSHQLTRVISPAMFEQNQRRINQQTDADDRNALDDVLAISDSSAKTSSSNENFPLPRVELSQAALKRSVTEEGLGNTNNNGRGTEEPLETSSNGMDFNSGSVATFFRDRKSLGKIATANSGRERYSNFHGGNKDTIMIDFPQRLQPNNVVDLLPLSHYRSDKNNFPIGRIHY